MKKFKPLTSDFLASVATASGMGHLLDFPIDYYAGLRENKKHDWSFWLNDGQRVDLAMGLDGGWAINVTEYKDQEKPKNNKE